MCWSGEPRQKRLEKQEVVGAVASAVVHAASSSTRYFVVPRLQPISTAKLKETVGTGGGPSRSVSYFLDAGEGQRR